MTDLRDGTGDRTRASGRSVGPQGCSDEALSSLRAVGDTVLRIWKLLNVGAPTGTEWSMWRLKVQQVVANNKLVDATLDLDVALVTIQVMAAHVEMRPTLQFVDAIADWEASLSAELRPNLVKHLATGFECIKCARDVGLQQLGEFCAKLKDVASKFSKVAHALLYEAGKSLINKRLEIAVECFNGVLKFAKTSFDKAFGAYAASECDMPAELDKMCAENSVLDDAAIGRFLAAEGMA